MEKTPVSKKAKLSVCIVCLALYAAGIALMFCGFFGPGLGFWVLSTVGGAFALYIFKQREPKPEETSEDGEPPQDEGN